MKIKPEERAKAIALAVGIVVFLFVFGIRVIPRLLPRGPQGQFLAGSTRTAATRPSLTTAVAPSNSTGTAPPVAASEAAPIVVPAATATDPFWRPLALSLQPDKLNAVPARMAASGLSKPMKFGSSAGSGPMQLAPIAPPPMPDVALQGIVQDETAMAVLEVGGQTRFLKAGATLEGGWVLKSIQTATVTLRQGRREVVLTLGQSLPKETTPVNENQGARGFATTLPPFHSIPLAP